ncbi:hypothetical protein OQA88_12568 [Cercophora sp. LCS_1]
MRLLQRKPDGSFCLTRDLIINIPPYAILSHTWGPDSEEVTFQDLTDGTGKDKAGYDKIRFCADQADQHGLQYFWIDTCCIKKTDSAELSEAINSMFKWYEKSTRCYVFLWDVPTATPGCGWESNFRESRWFKRGWTLQELLAPKSVQFFTRDGTLLGDKVSLQRQIREITSIDVNALCGAPLAGFQIEERFKWAESRQTTREEDWAYSLLGIFDVSMPVLYGEGRVKADYRLKKEIKEQFGGEGSPGHTQGQDGKVLGVCLVPYTSNPNFAGRSEILNQLEDELGFRSPQVADTAQHRVSLYGLGGVGKTQVAIEFLYRLRWARPGISVFWVHASTAERFRDAYSFIAKQCSIPSHEDPNLDVLPLVKNWLKSPDRGRWLMVVDNADDAELFTGPTSLAQWIPECAHGSILTTTRNKEAGMNLMGNGRLIEVDKMGEDESRQLLQGKLKGHNLDPEELATLSARLEHLPLALGQAAAFIQKTSISVNGYLRLLEESDDHLVKLLSEKVEMAGRDSDTPHALVQTWILSFEQIQQQDCFAGELLSLMSLFDRQAIPLEFLSSYDDNRDEWQKPASKRQLIRELGVRKGTSFILKKKHKKHQRPRGKIEMAKSLGTLKAFSLITEDNSRSYNMHRLVQLVTRKWLDQQHTMPQFADQALLIMSRKYPFGEYKNWAKCSAYLPHVHALLQLKGTGLRDGELARSKILHNAASFLDDQGRGKDAEKFLTQAVQIRTGLLGEEHGATLSSMTGLALIYRGQGRLKEAEGIDTKVLEIRKRVSGEEHPDTLNTINNLASTYTDQGRLQDAEELEVRCLEIRKRVLGEEHPDTLSGMSNLASTYRNQGRLQDAEELEVRCLEIRKRVLGEEHPDTLNTINNLASTYTNQGRLQDAEELEVRCLEIQKRVLGEEHPDTLMSMNNLAFTWKAHGRLREAIDLMRRCVDSRRRVLGSDHPYTEASIHYLLEWEGEAGDLPQGGAVGTAE